MKSNNNNKVKVIITNKMNKFNILDDGLIINKISKTYGNKEVIRDVSLKVKRGEIVGLLGPNGAGKTTSFYVIVGLVKQDRGSLYLDKKKSPIFQFILGKNGNKLFASRSLDF